MQMQKKPFTVEDIPTNSRETDLIYLVYKDVVSPLGSQFREPMEKLAKLGASVNPWDLPKGMIEAI